MTDADGDFLPTVALDRLSPVPLYHQLASAIEEQITGRTLVAGTRIENEIAMAQRLGVSRPTARRALTALVDKGLLVRRRGVGTQVAPDLVRRPVELTSLFDDLEASGRKPRTEVLAYDTVEADADVAARLRLPVGAAVVSVRRLRLADDEPLALMQNYLGADLAPSREDLEHHGLYEALRSRGVLVRVAHQSIGARLATAAEARVLMERRPAPVLTMERLAISDVGTVIELGRHIYRASRYSLSGTVSNR
jgi:DNA-binding GntR family transcriptional regulator